MQLELRAVTLEPDRRAPAPGRACFNNRSRGRCPPLSAARLPTREDFLSAAKSGHLVNRFYLKRWLHLLAKPISHFSVLWEWKCLHMFIYEGS